MPWKSKSMSRRFDLESHHSKPQKSKPPSLTTTHAICTMCPLGDITNSPHLQRTTMVIEVSDDSSSTNVEDNQENHPKLPTIECPLIMAPPTPPDFEFEVR